MILDTVIGIIAATLTTSSFIPQLIRAYRSKRIEDVSPYLMLLFSSGALLWLLYGMYRNDAIIITANIFALAFNIILLYMRVRYVAKGNA
jgi:MtN3 and saliva related transmembrane protein